MTDYAELADGLVDVLARDVERLRTVKADLLRRLANAEHDAVELARKADRLAVENAELRAENVGLQTAACVASLANDDAQAQLAVYDKIVVGLKTLQEARVRCDWYDTVWPLANASIESACNCDLEAGYAAADWIRANPKP
jgi:hypothetical protein